MSDDKKLVEKIESLEDELVSIYAEIYETLKGADRSELPDHVIADLESLDRPEVIEAAKAAAILKSILGSTSSDKFGFEYCWGVKMDNGRSLGGYVRERLEGIGIGYHDFWPYLKERGWLVET